MVTGWAAFLIDCLIGDPRSSIHPVCLMGNLISLLERFLYNESDSDSVKRIKGTVLMLLMLVICYSAAVYIQAAAAMTGITCLSFAVNAFFLSMVISPRSLAEAGREIREYLENGDIDNARFKVGWIVGRDTDKLSVGECTRATVETISENITDGILSPLFYWAIGGLPLAIAYRAANTMDSMIGYKNDKYLFFGRTAALCDDVWNYIPARITGILLVAAAWFWKYDYKNAWRMMLRDADKHPSPNGGYAEATVAGALGIRLGGLNYYFGRPSFRAYMGEPLKELGPIHIRQATRLMYTVTVFFLLVLSLIDFLR